MARIIPDTPARLLQRKDGPRGAARAGFAGRIFFLLCHAVERHLLFFFCPVNSLHSAQSVYLPYTDLFSFPLFLNPCLHLCPSKQWGCVCERAGDLERGSIRNLKINALSARKSMGLIGMPIVPVKTIKREEKCLTSSSPLFTQTQSERGDLKRNS